MPVRRCCHWKPWMEANGLASLSNSMRENRKTSQERGRKNAKFVFLESIDEACIGQNEAENCTFAQPS